MRKSAVTIVLITSSTLTLASGDNLNSKSVDFEKLQKKNKIENLWRTPVENETFSTTTLFSGSEERKKYNGSDSTRTFRKVEQNLTVGVTDKSFAGITVGQFLENEKKFNDFDGDYKSEGTTNFSFKYYYRVLNQNKNSINMNAGLGFTPRMEERLIPTSTKAGNNSPTSTRFTGFVSMGKELGDYAYKSTLSIDHHLAGSSKSAGGKGVYSETVNPYELVSVSTNVRKYFNNKKVYISPILTYFPSHTVSGEYNNFTGKNKFFAAHNSYLRATIDLGFSIAKDSMLNAYYSSTPDRKVGRNQYFSSYSGLSLNTLF